MFSKMGCLYSKKEERNTRGGGGRIIHFFLYNIYKILYNIYNKKVFNGL